MKRLAIACLFVSGCEVAPVDGKPDHPVPSKDELSYLQIKGAILRDARLRRKLNHHLDEGRREPVAAVSPEFPIEQLETIVLRNDPKEQRDGVSETALYSPSTETYLYHYVGGPKSLDVWMGPFPLARSK